VSGAPGQAASRQQIDPLLRDLLAWGLVEPARPADATATTWRLAENAQHRIEDLHTQRDSHRPHLVYFDRVCAGCRRRQMTRLDDGMYLCDACLARGQSPPTGDAGRGAGGGRGPTPRG
jgi:hypothetical protein